MTQKPRVETSHSGSESPVSPATPTPRERGADGQFLPGNRAAVTHGLYAAGDVPAEFAHLQAEVRQFVADALVDEGDLAQIPARRLALIEYRARLHRRIVQLDAVLELRGLTDSSGKLRVAWLQQLQSLMNAAKGIDSLLGLQKRTKKVTSLEEHVSERYGPTRTQKGRAAVTTGGGR